MILPLILILFGNEDVGDDRPVISDNIIQGEHIPGTVGGEEMLPTQEKPDEIQEIGTESVIADEEAVTDEPGAADCEAVTDEPGAADGEAVTDEPGTVDGEEENTEPEDAGPEEITGETKQDTEVKRVIDPEKPMVALTFDDGPYRNNTRAIMELFEQYGGRATFFVVGYHLDVYGEETLEAYQRGFQIGNHTMSHPKLPSLSDAEAMEEIRSLNDRLNELGIEGEAMVRTPYGLPTDYLRENLTVPMIGWNVDSEDWKVGTVDWIYQQLVGKVKDGDIVLLHDLHDVTAEAMQLVVPALVEQGFQLVTVEEMFAAKGIEPQAGEYYCYVR